MTMEQNVCAAEAIIFASGDGISTQKLKEVLDLDLKQLQFVLESLSEKYNTTENEICELNELKADETLKSGKCLILEKKAVLCD